MLFQPADTKTPNRQTFSGETYVAVGVLAATGLTHRFAVSIDWA